ncbi:hypothetical protein EQF91_07700 [Helcococcus ovis]|uniref:Uncharacterized protein n=1 Tax=Helcococcus ovis TaxID=72026 RepID=A0A4R9C212_9FIRM|nr:hypothetical protein [Helcococcus ovis]TFF64317.1 hypothetical protein EQF92_06145 [Helcococcus ovis]TFF64486.1 hypothetical protein EQF91_07700 [Helcococcus ovis]
MNKNKKILLISFILVFLISSYFILRLVLSNYESKSGKNDDIEENKKVVIDKDNKNSSTNNEKVKLKTYKKSKSDSLKNNDSKQQADADKSRDVQQYDDDLVRDNDVSIPRDIIEKNDDQNSNVVLDKNSNQKSDASSKQKEQKEQNTNAEPSDKYILINSNLRKDKYLIFDKNQVKLPEKSLVGLANTGEFENKLHELEWSGDSLEDVKSGKPGDYEIIAKIKDDLEINGHDYGKVIIKVKVRVK